MEKKKKEKQKAVLIFWIHGRFLATMHGPLPSGAPQRVQTQSSDHQDTKPRWHVTNCKSFTALESYEVSEQFASLVHEEIYNLHRVALVVCWCRTSAQPHLVGEFSPTYLRNRKKSWKSLENRHKKHWKTECSSQPLLTEKRKKNTWSGTEKDEWKLSSETGEEFHS